MGGGTGDPVSVSELSGDRAELLNLVNKLAGLLEYFPSDEASGRSAKVWGYESPRPVTLTESEERVLRMATGQPRRGCVGGQGLSSQ
jgi:hypothetical protein